MSSTIPYSTTSSDEPLDDLDSAGIPHFDATMRRKEKMRQAAASKQSVHSPAKPSAGSNGHAPATPTAAAPTTAPSIAPPAPVSNVMPSPAAPAAKPRLSGVELESFLIDFVVEQTGYPPEMVELDADLESDLGIDSIKKAQLFGELANDFDVKPSDDFSLDDFPTLRHVLELLESLPVSEPAASVPVPETLVTSPAPAPQQHAAPQPIVANSATDTPSSGGLSGAALEEFLVNFVVEQTGYPPEMVELDADLESDLGIDSIKKAQLFGELANEFDVKASDDLSLDDFPTLRHVKEFLEGAAPAPVASNGTAGEAVAVAPAPATAVVEVESSTGDSLSGQALDEYLVNFVVEQTGYPPEMVELDADLESDLGIDSIKKAQLFGELANEFDVQASDDLSLDDFPTLRHVKAFLENAQHATS